MGVLKPLTIMCLGGKGQAAPRTTLPGSPVDPSHLCPVSAEYDVVLQGIQHTANRDKERKTETVAEDVVGRIVTLQSIPVNGLEV